MSECSRLCWGSSQMTANKDRSKKADGAPGTWMLYGANGYAGLRIARKAKAQGLRPVLAGRMVATIKLLADELGLTWVAFAASAVSIFD